MDLGEAHEEVEATVAGDGVKIGFNARYVMEFLVAVDTETVGIQIGDPLSPAVFRPEGDASYNCVIMPMRI
jgi:DNA polymerase-3 subunit beta